jgi:class 3 adenylate cyclase
VTVLFSDLAGYGVLSERLDPEVLATLMARYFEAMGSIVARHGGRVEKFIGDALMAVFGLPLAHEDDALRAVRAAVDMGRELELLNRELDHEHGVRLAARTGVNTGVVFAGDPVGDQGFATGDPITVAQRLEGAAPPGAILLGEPTHRLVRHAVVAEPLGPLALKHKAAPLRAFRVVEVLDGTGPRSPSSRSRLVGREPERGVLRRAFERAVDDRSCRLLTVLGAPGVGKSRLVREFVEELGGRATVLRGRCLPYGDGITYWPVVELLRQMVGWRDGQRPAEILGGLAALLGDEASAEVVLRRIGHLVGAGEGTANKDETSWTVRKLLEAVARRKPAVCIIDDLQFGEPTLLDLVESIATLSRDAPILLVCLARTDLLEIRPDWGEGLEGVSALRVEPLARAQSGQLVANLLGGATLGAGLASAVVDLAGGNPLFVEEIVAMLVEDGLLRPVQGVWTTTGDLSTVPVPDSIQALLAARLDRLPAGERDVVERGAIEGEVFHLGGVAELSPGVPEDELESRPRAVAGKDLIGEHPTTFRGDRAFRFRHLLIRDAAYSALPKQLRARFHAGLADWLEVRAPAQDEIVGYHLEQACRYRKELGLARDQTLAARGAERLDAAARRALGRGDARAGSRLLERAASLFAPEDGARLVLLPRLGAAFFEAGRLGEAAVVLAEAIERAEGRGDARTAAHAHVERQFVRLMVESSKGIADASAVADAALLAFERHRDDFGCCRAWCLRAWIEWTRCSAGTADGAWRRAAVYARRTGQEQELFQILCWRASAALFGPTPVTLAVRRCEAMRRLVWSSPGAGAVVDHHLAGLHAMRGELDVARTLIRAGNEVLKDLGRMNSTPSHAEAWVELVAGDPQVAEELLQVGYERLERMGDRAFLASTAAMLAQAIYAQGRYGDAERFCEVSRGIAAADDVATQVMWRGVQAKILARRNRIAEADALARASVRIAEQTDWPTHHGDALIDLAQVLRQSGESGEANVIARRGIELFERKGNLVSAAAARSLLAEAAIN